MLAVAVFLSVCAAVMAAPQYAQPINNKDIPNNHNNVNVENMFKALDINSMVKAFDPKFVVVNEQQGEMPEGVHNALVKSLISDLHMADIPVVYAQKRDIPLN